MSVISISGTVTALGQYEFDNNVTIYAYLEITEPTGQRVMIDKVAVCNDTASLLQLGSAGDFFFDKMFVYGRQYHCQLWGIQSDTAAVIDRRNLRNIVATHHFLVGLFLLPFGGLGVFWLLPAIGSIFMMLSGGANRIRLFYGTNQAEVQRLLQRQAAHI